MLVATARGNMAFGVKEASTSWQSEQSRDSRTIWNPINPRRTKAIQWSTWVIKLSSLAPRR